MQGEIPSLEPEHIVPHLKDHLHWRVLVEGGVDEEVPGLVVCVSSAESTDGRPAGLNVGEEA
ncbi:LOW QUALITY PROTEIN: uncharacterized protein B0I36DRAFT_342541 [Microdochium trichocladiopsis]|uniref:Tyrosinase C-terminal domain-containing protein n=1 Tax=Microdochium trichocladiopsis TaxID=1682393 RepID=A0A9P8XPJ5_9PEZI|nr:LOW QUALITY PROTEIN: uncharacterized protein B0I36DRAFT_342541 [Microdochium trichocladiopsis]KAH7009201.1 LOW QUALITY PROTEIN: hypothetical protein B0I36DRAFT_342541 [Microdochium trichocladiopsis]